MEVNDNNSNIKTESADDGIMKEQNYTYIVQCLDGTYYCGWTNNLEKRIEAHNKGKGAKYTRARLPVKLVCYEEYDTKHDAMSREWQIKRMSREEKIKLISFFNTKY